MQADDVRMTFDYSYWAMDRLIIDLEQLTQAEFSAPAEVPHGSLQALLAHTLSAEHFQRAWWQGKPMAWQRESFEEPETPAAFRDAWKANEGEMRAFIATLSDQDLRRPVSMEPRQHGSLPLGLLVQHIANHTMQHRTEAAIVLTRAGHSPGDLDLLFYALARGMAEA